MAEARTPYLPVSGEAPFPALWLGTWALGGEGFGKVDARDAARLLQAAVAGGFRHFDSAGFYAHGRSEALLRPLLAGGRERLFIAGKGGLEWHGREVRHAGGEAALRAALEQTLNRLSTDYLDLYQLHWPDPSVELAESIHTLQALQREGKIRYWGVCNLDALQVSRLLPAGGRVVHQVHHNLLVRADDVLAAGMEGKRTWHCAYSPLEQGLLADRPDGAARLGRRDVRRRNPLFHESRVLARAVEFDRLCLKYGLSKIALAYQWLRLQPGIDGVLCGPRILPQLQALLAMCDQPPLGLWDALDSHEKYRRAQEWREQLPDPVGNWLWPE